MSMKLPAMFDQNLSHKCDKIVENRLQKKTLSKLDPLHKCQGHSRNQKTMTLGTKNMPAPPNRLRVPPLLV